MNQARLSPAQRAYLFQPAQFLERLDERAKTLYQAGYRLSCGETCGEFWMTLSAGDTMRTYCVNAREQTCTCAFFVRQTQGEALIAEGVLACKHLRGLRQLVRQMRLAHFKAGEFSAGYRLWIHWIATLSVQMEQGVRVAVPPSGTTSSKGETQCN